MITMELMMMMMMMTMKWHRPTGVENVESDAKHLNNNLLQLKLLSSASWSWIIILIKKIVLSSSLSWIIIIIEIKVKPLVACKLIFPPEEMSLMSLLSWELITTCEMSQELSMKCRTILLKWRCIGGDECWPNWQWKTFQRNIWGGCYKVFQTCNNILGTCWVFAKNDWNTINQMEALDENNILDQECALLIWSKNHLALLGALPSRSTTKNATKKEIKQKNEVTKN